ncbi:hypothetical protein [Cellulomonas sp.]|nr:hypothetical protein [Cellulomonas sp.]MBO9556415.1 hypothetical protein [Cellulomonas sp.]
MAQTVAVRPGSIVNGVDEVDRVRSLHVDDIAVVAAPTAVGERHARLRPR